MLISMLISSNLYSYSISKDYVEMITAFTNIYRPNQHNRLCWMFHFYDHNSDGIIDEMELETSLKVRSNVNNYLNFNTKFIYY